MMRVFDGGVGSESGGKLERSIDIGDRDFLEVGRDEAGELPADILKVIVLLVVVVVVG